MHAVSSILEKILQEKRREVSALQESYSVSDFSQQIAEPALSFASALLAVKGSAIIAEVILKMLGQI